MRFYLKYILYLIRPEWKQVQKVLIFYIGVDYWSKTENTYFPKKMCASKTLEIMGCEIRFDMQYNNILNRKETRGNSNTFYINLQTAINLPAIFWHNNNLCVEM